MVRGELAQDCRDTAARSLDSSLRGAAALRRSASSDKAKLACSLESPYRRSSLPCDVVGVGISSDDDVYITKSMTVSE